MCVCVCVCWCCSQTDLRLSGPIRIMTVGSGRCPNWERGRGSGGWGVIMAWGGEGRAEGLLP